MRKYWFLVFIVALLLIASPVFAEEDVDTSDNEPSETANEPSDDTSEAGVEPEKVDGNPLSGKGADEHKVDSPSGGDTGTKEIPCDVELDDLGESYPDITDKETIEVDYEISEDNKSLSWSSDNKVSEVVVKGGPSANVYYYYDGDTYLGLWDEDNGRWYDSGLRPPVSPGGQDPTISNFGFFADCPDAEDENGTNGEEPNGNDTNGNGTNGNGPPPVGNGVVRTTTPPVGVELPEIEATPVSLPATGGSPILFLIGLGLFSVGIAIVRK